MAYIFSLAGSLFFSYASIYYTKYSRSQSSLWMNICKSGVALLAGALWLSLSASWSFESSWYYFFISGLLGLGIGDYLLLFAFSRLGAARTMILWGFQPLLIGVGSYYLFAQPISLRQLVAILLFIGCIGIFSYEKRRSDGHWGFVGLFAALGAVTLDAGATIISRYGFEHSVNLNVFEGQFYRSLGALLSFFFLSLWLKPKFFKTFFHMPLKEKYFIVFISFIGTFLAIYCGLYAIKIGHLSTIAALTITAPLFTAIFEHIHERKKPPLSFLVAIILFIIGFILLLKS